jgi:ketosteroid isomerase-like protein
MTRHPDIVAAFLAAYNSGDSTQIAGLFPADGWQEDVAPGRMNKAPAGIATGLAPFFEAVPDAHWTETDRIVAGTSIVVIYNLTGHLQKDLGPFKARGQSIAHPGVFVLKLCEGQIVNAQDFWDPVEFGRQVDRN